MSGDARLPTFARLVKHGLLDRAEALSALIQGREAKANERDASGLRARAAWALDAAIAAAPPPDPPAPAALEALPARLPDPASIPPRAWLYGTSLVRGFVSVLAAPGGVGKSALALAQAVALATGKPLLGERVHHAAPGWLLDLEDPPDELDRRLAACLRLHAVPETAVAGRLFLHSGRARRVCVAALEGPEVTYPDRDGVVAAARARGIGLIVVDPFVRSHRLDENSNPQMDAAAAAWTEVAARSDAAVLLVHHMRKLGGAVADVESARGAKALTDAARSASVLTPMSEEEAERLEVPRRERFRYVRLDDAKANLAPRAEQARWLRLESVGLGNGTALYPAGDAVVAVRAWTPQNPFAGMDAAACNRALDLIESGPEQGRLFTAHRTGRASPGRASPGRASAGGARWVGLALMEHGASEAEAGRIVALWLKSGLLVETAYRDPGSRKTRRGVQVVAAKRPTLDLTG